jgi:hypothetical protein
VQSRATPFKKRGRARTIANGKVARSLAIRRWPRLPIVLIMPAHLLHRVFQSILVAALWRQVEEDGGRAGVFLFPRTKAVSSFTICITSSRSAVAINLLPFRNSEQPIAVTK